MNEFHFLDSDDIGTYDKITAWALRARGQNPGVFDALTEWILDDSHWGDDKLAENEQILMQGVFARFKEQNARLRAYLRELEPTGVVNAPVFKALDRFDEELRETVARTLAGFSAMRERGVRESIVGYIHSLRDCDAQVQWTLFMPDVVKHQQKGFKVDSFEYKTMPAMRFIGREGDDLDGIEVRKQLFRTLDAMDAYKSGFDHDILFMHHYGLGVDVGPWHGVFGRFMKANAPVPEGFLHFDFIPHDDGKAGPPYCSQFAFAIFSGDTGAMHGREGFDSDAMYDVTRNIILGQGVHIPYPAKYWTAEVFLNGCDKPGAAYLFSAMPH